MWCEWEIYGALETVLACLSGWALCETDTLWWSVIIWPDGQRELHYAERALQDLVKHFWLCAEKLWWSRGLLSGFPLPIKAIWMSFDLHWMNELVEMMNQALRRNVSRWMELWWFLSCILFVQWEVAQDSAGPSPFDVLNGWQLKAPYSSVQS